MVVDQPRDRSGRWVEMLGGVDAPTASPLPPTLEAEPPAEASVTRVDDAYARFARLTRGEPDPPVDKELAVLSPREREEIEAARRVALNPASTRITDSSQETRIVATSLAQAWGINRTEMDTIIGEYRHTPNLESGVLFDYVEPMEAQMRVRALAEEPPFSVSTRGTVLEETLADVGSGKLRLTREELDGLTNLRDHAYHSWASANENDLGMGEEWVSAAVNRRCEVCQQFISTRDSHGKLKGLATITPQGEQNIDPRFTYCTGYVGNNFGTKIKYSPTTRAAALLDDDDLIGPVEQVDDIPSPKLSTLTRDGYSAEFIEDAYMGDDELRAGIIGAHITGTGLFGRRKIVQLPDDLREAVIEAPPGNTGNGPSTAVMVLAARLEPQLTDQEVARMISRGDISTLTGLLRTRRTRDAAIRAITTRPTSVTADAALAPDTLGTEAVSKMAASPNPDVRALAAASPDLSEHDAVTLAHDPNPAVRRALVMPHPSPRWATLAAKRGRAVPPARNTAIGRHPIVVETLINDPNETIATSVFESLRYPGQGYTSAQPEHDIDPTTIMPRDKRAAFTTAQKHAIGKIRDPRRITALKRHVLNNSDAYNTYHPDVARFLAYPTPN